MATDALRRGVQEHNIQEFLGHADARTTRVYAKLAKQGFVDVLRPSFVGGLSVAENELSNGSKLEGELVSPAGFEPALPA